MFYFFSKLRVNEVEEGAVLVTGIPSKYDLTEYPELAGIFSEVDVKKAKLQKISTKYIPQSVLAEYNEARQIAVRDLYEYVEGLSRHPDPVKREKGLKILGALDSVDCKLVLHRSMADTTHIASSLINTLNSSEFSVIVTETGDLSLYLANVETKNQSFESKRSIYEHQKAEKYVEENLSECKDELLHVMNKKLIAFLNYKIEAEPDLYSKLYAEVENIVTTVNENERRRKTMRDNKPDDKDEK